MTQPQLNLYRVLWSQAKKALRARGMSPADAEAERHAIHRERLGFDKSSKDLTNDEFDVIKGAFLAISKASDLNAQIAQQEMPETRLRFALRHYAAAIDGDDDYVDAIARRMDRELRKAGGHLSSVEKNEAELTAAQLNEIGLKKVLFAVKKQCRRRWSKKEDLLEDLFNWLPVHCHDHQAAQQVICAALRRPVCPELGKLVYEDLLIAFGALKLAAIETITPRISQEQMAI